MRICKSTQKLADCFVGYTTKAAPQAKFNIGAVPFEAVDGSMLLNKILTGFTPVEIDWDDPTAFYTTAAQLQIWNAAENTYDMAYYVSNAWKDDGTEEGQYVEGWCDGDGLLREDYEFVPGGAYWVKNIPDSKSLTMSGAVKGADLVSFSATENFALAGNAYPVAIALDKKNQMKSDDIVPVTIDWDDPTAFYTTATQLQIWNSDLDTYDMAYYVSNAWVDDGTEEGQYVEGWCDGDGLLRVDYTIPAGNGFWVKAVSGACHLDFINPIAK